MEKTPPAAENVTPTATSPAAQSTNARPSNDAAGEARAGCDRDHRRRGAGDNAVSDGARHQFARKRPAGASGTRRCRADVSAGTSWRLADDGGACRVHVRHRSAGRQGSVEECGHVENPKHRIGGAPKSASRIGASAPLADAHSEADSAAVLASPDTPTAEPALASASVVATSLAPVTITGCLEVSVDAGEYRLSETEGVETPRSRSWR